MGHLDTRQAANRLRKKHGRGSTVSLYRYISRGLLRSKKVSNEIFVDEKDLAAFTPPRMGRPPKNPE